MCCLSSVLGFTNTSTSFQLSPTKLYLEFSNWTGLFKFSTISPGIRVSSQMLLASFTIMYEPRWNSAVFLDHAGPVLLKGLQISVLLKCNDVWHKNALLTEVFFILFFLAINTFEKISIVKDFPYAILVTGQDWVPEKSGTHISSCYWKSKEWTPLPYVWINMLFPPTRFHLNICVDSHIIIKL